jgi:MoxR-like ATPase
MENLKIVRTTAEKIIKNLEKVIVGKHGILEQVTICLLCQGHLLIEDVPGTGKTVLARSLARSIDSSFSRIQFTPDMLPSDITGVSVFNQVSRQFEFKPGPVLAHIVLADEINRATPKTQSALLEAMEERQVTIDGVTHKLEQPFMVIGTQNPIEYEGTFPLPEAQLDRFLMRVSLGYPSLLEEIRVMENQQFKHPFESLDPVVKPAEILRSQEAIKGVLVSHPVKRYITDLVRASRENGDVYLGASPRGSLGLFRTGQALAAIRDRDFVTPDDIKAVAETVLPHRMVIQPAAKLHDMTTVTVVREIINNTAVPTGEFRVKTE